jgi:hypothetical protein
MKWLILAVILIAQQPAKAPEGKRTAESDGAQSGAHTKTGESKQSPSPQPTPGPTQPTVGTENERRGSTAANHLGAGNQQTSDEDRATQRKLTWFTEVLALVGVLQLVIMFFTLRVYTRQAREMRRSRHEMRRQRHVMFGQYRAMRDQIAQMEQAGRQTGELIAQASTQSGLLALAGTHTETLAAQAVKQSSLTQRQLDLANRPWICIDSVTPASDMTFKDSGEAVIFLTYQLRNVGHSVAQHLQPWFEAIITGIHNPVEVRDRISAQLKKPINSAFDHGKLIFPSQVIVDAYPVLIRKEVIQDAIKNSPFKQADDKRMPCFGLELFVCFDYQSTLDPAIHHQTQSMYILAHSGPGGGAFYPSQRVYKANEIRVAYKGHGAYAY